MKRAFRHVFAMVPFFVIICVVNASSTATAEDAYNGSAKLQQIAANDNRQAAGMTDATGVHIDLVARRGLWFPDGPGTLGAPMAAFGEAGKSLQIPAPLIRMPAGTSVTIKLRNALSGETLHVHGFASATAGDVPITIASGQARVIRFRRDTPGTYVYWASDKSEALGTRLGRDAGLSGAIVVDEPHHPQPVDRVFVINTWIGVMAPDGSPNYNYELQAINGRSWPATEPLTYSQGSTVRWRIVNGGLEPHAMHLHGFPFIIDSVGDGTHDLSFAGRPPLREVTERLEPDATFAMHWRADRPGMWMFHCHTAPHILAHAPMAVLIAGHPLNPHEGARRLHYPVDSMGGMILAVHVTPAHGDQIARPWSAQHAVALDVFDHTIPNPRGFAKGSFAYVEHDRGAVVPSSGIIGAPIILTAGEPTTIAVTNHLAEPTTVHWHGIQVEHSYDDGGAGMRMDAGAMSGMEMRNAKAHAASAGAMMAPAIAPGQTFIAHVTAPHAGTFMYHTHMDDTWQLVEGLAGPLVVLPRGQTFDATTDHIVMVTVASDHPFGDVVRINGSLTPEPIVVHAGVSQRLRLINMTAVNTEIVVSLDGPNNTAWTPIAKDGYDLDPQLQHARTATQQVTIGETRDFRFTPATVGALSLDVFDSGSKVGSVAVQVEP